MTNVKMEITYIPVRQLSVVWVQSQRPYVERHARAIADDFDPDKFEPIIVTKPNGEGVYHIIEGQHRRHALEMFAAKMNRNGRGDSEMAPCRIVADADPARAAEIWLGINGGRKAVKPIRAFQVAVTAGRETEVTIDQMVRHHGFYVGEYKKSDCIGAVRALKDIFVRHGRPTLAAVLRIVRRMWDGDPIGSRSAMLRGLALFMNEFGPHVSDARMDKIAEKWSPYRLGQAAEAHKQSTMESMEEAISNLLFREYNKGLKESQKLRRKE